MKQCKKNSDHPEYDTQLCPVCRKEYVDAYNKRRYAEDPMHRQRMKDRARDHHLMKKYGITFSDYIDMLVEQKGQCAICGRIDPGGRVKEDGLKMFAVDHDHSTGKVRALLCMFCNVAIGNLGDDIEMLKKAIAYLEKHQDAEG